MNPISLSITSQKEIISKLENLGFCSSKKSLSHFYNSRVTMSPDTLLAEQSGHSWSSIKDSWSPIKRFGLFKNVRAQWQFRKSLRYPKDKTESQKGLPGSQVQSRQCLRTFQRPFKENIKALQQGLRGSSERVQSLDYKVRASSCKIQSPKMSTFEDKVKSFKHWD